VSPVLPASELVPVPDTGRRFVSEQAVRLGDVDPSGQLRLDATARHLQDVANDDAVDSGLDNSFGWVVRRTLIRVEQPPVLGERLRLTTFCSGIGRSWAERRTSITGDSGGVVEAASLWVQVDPATGRPTGLGRDFLEIYGDAAGGRKISTRLSLPGPGADVAADAAATVTWPIRRVDLDVFGHVNNAIAWAILHEIEDVHGDGAGTGELEHLAPAGPDDSPLTLRSNGHGPTACSAWLVAGDTVRVAARWSPDTRA
jgi:acyl-ACP thioesterase